MLLHFIRLDLAQRFGGSLLGLAWAILAPLLQLAMFALVFSQIFKARVPGLEGLGYVAFLSLGMWPWFAFSEAVSRGASAFTDNAGLLSKVVIPPWKLVAARAIVAYGLHGSAFVLVAALLHFFVVPLHPLLALVSLPAWGGLLILAFALGLLFAASSVFIRDIQQMIQYVLSALMFLSPILYTAAMVPESLRGWLLWNPLTGYVEAIRDPLLFGELDSIVPLPAALSTATCVVLAALVYRRLRPHVVEFL